VATALSGYARGVPLLVLVLVALLAAPAQATRLTIEANGDLLIHQPVWQRAAALAGGTGYRFSPLLRHVRPWIRDADVALCHIETPMTPAPPRGYPVFNTPPALARAVRRTGWDACSTASNHTLDRGQGGVGGTLRALDGAGVAHAGSARSPREARRITLLRAKGVRIAFLAYTALLNGGTPPHPWSVNVASAARIRRDARRARRQGAEVVIVNLHWGTEYQPAPSAAQRELVRRLESSRAITAIVGQHVHVVQPIRRPGGRWVVYGEGNLLSNQTAACCPAGSQDGILAFLHVRVRDGRATVPRVSYLPTWVRHPDFAVLPVREALRRGWAPRAALLASLRRTVRVIGHGPRLSERRRLPGRRAGVRGRR
jgi:poly-gamma-glutamate synthesis protein (capsule biosynthesis protein)